MIFEISYRNESLTHRQNDSYMSVAPGLKNSDGRPDREGATDLQLTK